MSSFPLNSVAFDFSLCSSFVDVVRLLCCGHSAHLAGLIYSPAVQCGASASAVPRRRSTFGFTSATTRPSRAAALIEKVVFVLISRPSVVVVVGRPHKLTWRLVAHDTGAELKKSTFCATVEKPASGKHTCCVCLAARAALRLVLPTRRMEVSC